MSLRPTFTPPGAARYRRPGGPWSGPALDEALPLAGTGPDRLTDAGTRWSGDELDERVAEVAGGLRALGVRHRDVVAWQLPNWREAVVLYRACWRLGAVAAPIHHGAGPSDVAAMVERLQPRVILGQPTLAVPPGPPGLFLPLRPGELPAGRPVRASAARPADVATVLFTSGSTGRPKAVLHTHRALAYKAHLMAGAHGLTAADAILMPAPLAHISGLLNGVLVPEAASMRVVLMDHWSPAEALGIIERERITFMIGPPTFFVGLLGDGRILTGGGEQPAAHLQRRGRRYAQLCDHGRGEVRLPGQADVRIDRGPDGDDQRT